MWSWPYPSHPEIGKDTSSLAPHYTSILRLGRPCVAVHLGELQLRLGAGSLRQRGVADNVSKGLPLWLGLLKDLSFCVVPDDFRVDEARQIQPLCAELRHLGQAMKVAMVDVVEWEVKSIQRKSDLLVQTTCGNFNLISSQTLDHPCPLHLATPVHAGKEDSLSAV